MKKILALLLMLGGAAFAQSPPPPFMTVTASSIYGTGGQLLSSGTMVFQATDSNGNPVGYQVNGGGQQITYPTVCSIVAGAITGSCQLPNVSVTNPLNVCFALTIKDANNNIISPPSNGYQCVQPQTTNPWCSSGTCNFDKYVPNNPSVITANLAPPQNSSLGGLYAQACPSGQVVTGIVAGTGYVTCGAGTGGLIDPGASGIVKRTTLNTTAIAAYQDIVGLWTSCTSGFLQYNGTCSTATGTGNVTGPNSSTIGDVAVYNVTNGQSINDTGIPLNSLASLNSPVFTGTPTAPTPSISDNSTKLATTAFVQGQNYAPLASPTFIGVPAVPTQSLSDNSTEAVNSAWVKGQGYGVGTLTGVTTSAGSGLSGGCSSGNCSLSIPSGGVTNSMLAIAYLQLGGGALTGPVTSSSTVAASFNGSIGATTPNAGSFTTLSTAAIGTFPTLNQNTTGTSGGLLGCPNPAAVAAGSFCYSNGSAWSIIAGNTTTNALILSEVSGTPSWITAPTGGGNVQNSGTPTSGQLALWTSATVIQGVTTLPASAEPAHTGDAQNSAGSLSMTVKGINGTTLSSLATGLLKNTTGTGVPSTAVAGTDYVVPSGSITGTAGNITGVAAPANGGTGSSSAPAAGQLLVGTAGSLYAPQSLSQDVSLVASGAVTVSGLQSKALPALSAFSASPYLIYTGTAWAAANPFANPTFTGAVTLPITGAVQCLQVSAVGVVGGTGSACGSGGGGGNMTGPSTSVANDIVLFNNTTGTLTKDSGVAFPIPNTGLANSTTGVSGTSNQICTTSASIALGSSSTLSICNPFTFPGKATFAAAGSSSASFNIPATSTPPSSPTAGDVWNFSGVLQFSSVSTTNTLTWITGTAPVAADLTQFGGTTGMLSDSGIAVANVPTVTATPAANQLAVFASTSKAITPTTTLPTAAEPAHTGDVTNSAGSLAMTLATVNSSPGSCGDATHVCQITTNGKGLTTSQVAVAITTGNVSGPGTSTASDIVLFNNTSGTLLSDAGFGFPLAAAHIGTLSAGSNGLGGFATITTASATGFARDAAGTVSVGLLVSGDIPNNAANTTGNAATATALTTTPTQCTGGQFATGIAANGNANCAAQSGGGNVTGPSSSTSSDVAAFNNTTGSLLLDTGIPYTSLVTLTGTQTLTNKTITGTFAGPLSGNATTATGLSTTGANGTVWGVVTGAQGWQTIANSFNGRTGAVTPQLGDYTPTLVGLGNVTNNAQTQAAIVPNTAPSAGQILVGNAGSTAYAPVTVGGSCALTSAGGLTCSYLPISGGTLTGPVTGTTFTATTFTGALSGNASTATALSSTGANGLFWGVQGGIQGYYTPPSSSLSGMTSGQLAVAGSAIAVTSSVPFGLTGNSTIVETNSSGQISTTVMGALLGAANAWTGNETHSGTEGFSNTVTLPDGSTATSSGFTFNVPFSLNFPYTIVTSLTASGSLPSVSSSQAGLAFSTVLGETGGIIGNPGGTGWQLYAGFLTSGSTLAGGKCIQDVVSSGVVSFVEASGACGSGSGGLSGMTAGQIPVAATASTVTSSIAYGTTGNSVLLETGSGGQIAASVVPFAAPGAIGGTTPSTGAFTTVTATTSVSTGGGYAFTVGAGSGAEGFGFGSTPTGLASGGGVFYGNSTKNCLDAIYNVSGTTTDQGCLGVQGSGLGQFASTTSAQLAAVLSDDIGSGFFVRYPAINGSGAGLVTGPSTTQTNAICAYSGNTGQCGTKSYGDITPLNYAAGGGTAQAQTVALAQAATALTAGLDVRWLPTAANTAAAPTLGVNALTATTITKCGQQPLVAGDLITTKVAHVIYDGTYFELQNPVNWCSAAPPGVTPTFWPVQIPAGVTLSSTFQILAPQPVGVAMSVPTNGTCTSSACVTNAVLGTLPTASWAITVYHITGSTNPSCNGTSTSIGTITIGTNGSVTSSLTATNFAANDCIAMYAPSSVDTTAAPPLSISLGMYR